MVTRDLVFYRWSDINAQPPFSPPETATRLARLIAKDEYAAMLEYKEVATAVHVIEVGDDQSPTQLRMMSLRNPGFRPVQWELGGDLVPLPILDDQYPADVTYVSIWPDGYAAQDLHQHAARVGRLSNFFRHRVSSYVSFEILYQPNLYKLLVSMKGKFRKVQISMTRPEYVDKDRGAFGILVPEAYGHSVPSIQVSASVGRYGPRDRYLDSPIDEAIISMAENAHEYVDMLKVYGRNPKTGAIEKVNLLKQRLQRTVDLPPDPRANSLPDMKSTFDAMELAYRNLRMEGELERATQAKVALGRK